MTVIERGRWFPQAPPRLDDETDDAYTDRLTGADHTDRIPYDHRRNRQCSIGWHGECSDPGGESCECPCHTPEGKLEVRVRDLEESVVALWAVASRNLPEPPSRQPGWGKRILAGEHDTVMKIIAERPNLAEWYVKPEARTGDGQ